MLEDDYERKKRIKKEIESVLLAIFMFAIAFSLQCVSGLVNVKDFAGFKLYLAKNFVFFAFGLFFEGLSIYSLISIIIKYINRNNPTNGKLLYLIEITDKKYCFISNSGRKYYYYKPLPDAPSSFYQGELEEGKYYYVTKSGPMVVEILAEATEKFPITDTTEI